MMILWSQLLVTLILILTQRLPPEFSHNQIPMATPAVAAVINHINNNIYSMSELDSMEFEDDNIMETIADV